MGWVGHVKRSMYVINNLSPRAIIKPNCNACAPLGHGIPKRADPHPPLLQHPLDRLAQRGAIILKPRAQQAHTAQHHALERRMLAQPQHLLRVQLHEVLDDVVVGDVVAPALGADVVARVQREAAAGAGRRARGAPERRVRGGRAEGVGGGRWRGRRVRVEEQRVLGVRVVGVQGARDGAVAGADVVADYVAEDRGCVGDFAELARAPVVQQGGALQHDGPREPGFARVLRVVEGARVQPDAVDGAAEAVAFAAGEEAARFVVVLPFFEWVQVAPFRGDAAGVCHLLDEGEREGHAADYVGWLAGVVGEELREVLQRAVLGFGGMLQDGQALGRKRDVVEAATRRRQCEDVVDRAAGEQHLDDQLGSEVLEEHVGCVVRLEMSAMVDCQQVELAVGVCASVERSQQVEYRRQVCLLYKRSLVPTPVPLSSRIDFSVLVLVLRHGNPSVGAIHEKRDIMSDHCGFGCKLRRAAGWVERHGVWLRRCGRVWSVGC